MLCCIYASCYPDAKDQLALIIYRNNRFYMYRSLDHGSLPPSRADIVCLIAADSDLAHCLIGKIRPLPVLLCPEDLKNLVKKAAKASGSNVRITVES